MNKKFSKPMARLIGLSLILLGLTCSALAGVVATRNLDQMQLVPIAFAPADPGFSTTVPVPLPKSRPDQALYHPAVPVEITLPYRALKLKTFYQSLRLPSAK